MTRRSSCPISAASSCWAARSRTARSRWSARPRQLRRLTRRSPAHRQQSDGTGASRAASHPYDRHSAQPLRRTTSPRPGARGSNCPGGAARRGLRDPGSSDDSAGGAGAPPVLRLTDYQATAADTSTGDNDLRLSADLPAGPDDAAVRWLTSPDSAEVERLAKALGLRGQRARGGGATTYTSDSASLRVQERAGGSGSTPAVA